MRSWPGDVVAPQELTRWFRDLLRPPTPTRAHMRVLAFAVVAVFVVGSVSALFQGMRVEVGVEAEVASAGKPLGGGHRAERRPRHEAAPRRREARKVERRAERPKVKVLPAHEVRRPRSVAAVQSLGLLPTGKGMWFHMLEQAAGGDPGAIVRQARAAGLSHVYVRTGSSKGGFYAQGDLDRILPVAHAAGLAVVGWDFPYLHDPAADARRAVAAIRYETPSGHRLDAFSADIETGSEGVALAAERVDAYGRLLREAVGEAYPLVGTVPNACLNQSYPYAQVAKWFDAFAPMVYWITRDPALDVACNLEKLRWFGLPVLPIGQAYDPAIDNPAMVGLVPGYGHLRAFMDTAAELGAAGVSFWAWHTATPQMWRAVADSPHFTLVPMRPGHGNARHVLVLQRLLNAYGHRVPLDGRYGERTGAAVAGFQRRLGLPPTGILDAPTLAALT